MASADTRQGGRGVVVLGCVPYRTYARLRSARENAHLRMTYHDGILELMSPEYAHERSASRIGMFIRALACELGIPCTSARSTTFRRAGAGPDRGHGKEPDESFYLAHEPDVRGKAAINLDAGDPPPDLWIEVDHRASSRGKLPLYAALGVPEVWRYRTRKPSLSFVRLTDEGHYEPIERSLALPMVTPGIVLNALALADNLPDSVWDRRIRDEIRRDLAPNP